jgi:hypothetical protein
MQGAAQKNFFFYKRVSDSCISVLGRSSGFGDIMLLMIDSKGRFC